MLSPVSQRESEHESGLLLSPVSQRESESEPGLLLSPVSQRESEHECGLLLSPVYFSIMSKSPKLLSNFIEKKRNNKCISYCFPRMSSF